MKASSVRRLGIALVVAVLMVGTTASAQQEAYSLSWATVAGGGTSSGGMYTVSAVAAQPEVSAGMSGGTYTMAGGVWGSPIAPRHTYLPLLLQR